MKRQLEPKMVSYLDAKLAGNGLAQSAIKNRDPRTVFRLALECCVGIREKGGNNRGPMVELIQETLGGADAEAWCMSLVQTGLGYAELKTGIMSPIFPSEHCLTVWNETPREQRVRTVPAVGAICIWKHGDTTSGHTGITVGEVEREEVNMVEGNTEAGIRTGEVVREGGGVYFTRRSIRGTGSMKVVGYLKPWLLLLALFLTGCANRFYSPQTGKMTAEFYGDMDGDYFEDGKPRFKGKLKNSPVIRAAGKIVTDNIGTIAPILAPEGVAGTVVPVVNNLFERP